MGLFKFSAICLHCILHDDPSTGQFIDALNTSIINYLAFKGLLGAISEDHGFTLLDDLHFLLIVPNASSPNSSKYHGREEPDDIFNIFHISA
jgi:hypothetical protein